MNAIGTPELSWVKGYNGKKARYIDKSTIVYECGNNINFMKEDGESIVFTSPGEGVTALDVHPLNKVFAFAELCIKPRIFVYKYPELKPVSELTDGAQLEYAHIAFSSSDYLITITGIPDFSISLWNYEKGQCLFSMPVTQSPIISLAVNPGNWRQISVATAANITLFTVEQSDTKYNALTRDTKMIVGDRNVDAMDDSASHGNEAMAMHKLELDLSPSAIAGLMEPEAETFEDYRDDRLKVTPVSQAWTPAGDVLIGCMNGQLLRLDAETVQLKLIFSPSGSGPSTSLRDSTMIRGASLLSKDMSIMEEDTTLSAETAEVITRGAFRCMALHKKGLYIGGEDGHLRCIDVTNDNVKLLDSFQVGVPITSLDFSTNWSHLNIGSDQGSMYTYDVNAPGKVNLVMDEHNGNFVGIQSLAPGFDHAVSIRANGEIQVWSLQEGLLEGSMNLGVEVTALACSPLAPIVVVGTSSGFLFVVDLTEPQKGRIIHRTRAYNKAVTHITYTTNGEVILLGAEDGYIIMMSGKANDAFKMLFFTSVEGAVETITTFHHQGTDNIHVIVSSCSIDDVSQGANKCTTFHLSPEVIAAPESHYASLKAEILDESINKMVFNYASPSFGACLAGPDILLSLAQDNKKMQKIIVPKEKPKKSENEPVILNLRSAPKIMVDNESWEGSPVPRQASRSNSFQLSMTPKSLRASECENLEAVSAASPNSKDSFLLPEVESNSHQLPGGRILLSPHGKWIASVGTDGKLQVKTVSAQERFVEAHPHDYRHGGVRAFCWSAGGQHLLTIGKSDGILTCYAWRYTMSGETKGKSALAAAKSAQNKLAELVMIERDAVKAMTEWGPEGSKVSFESSHSTMSNIERAINNDEIYSTPTPVPKADTTWIEARQILAHSEEDKQYSEVKKDLRFEIRDIRRTLQGLMEKNKTVPDIEKLQHNDFDLDVDEQNRLQGIGDAEVKRIREAMEFENLAKQYLTYLIKQECWDTMEVKGRSIEGFDIALDVQNYPMQKRLRGELDELSRAVAVRKIEMAEAKTRSDLVETPVPKPSQALGTEEPELAADDDGDEDELAEGEAPSVTGSNGALYGGKSELFYNQFELYCREQKVTQIILLKDAIHRIKITFNKEFDEVMKKKEQELSKINEKTKRIAKIFIDLNMIDEVILISMSTKEKPELLLKVEDSEVKVEKYLTPEQRKQKEEEEKAEEERRKREQGDNARERALDQMMGGVLEIKKEDELKKDVPIPSFIQGKDQDDWSEEEHKQQKEYERRVKELNEEREKYRKQLEAELKKNQLLIAESQQAFNDQLKALFTRKLKVEMVICQEELKILRLQWGLMFEQALETTEKQIVSKISHKKQLKQLAAEAYITARKNVDSFKEGYDILVAEDKVMDKGFKREFADLPALQNELLYKLFRKRPRATKILHNRGETPILDANSGNPFAERPSTARQNLMQRNALDNAITELDKTVNVPEGVDEFAWERLCKYRRTKIESELLVRQKALVMAEMMSFQQKRQDEDYKLAEEIDDLGQELSRLKDMMQRFHLNLQVQLLMKQGQVELDAGSFIHEYKDSVLIHRSVVEDLNGKIKALGESKIASMMESKEFRKGIIQLEWEHKKNLMKIEDLKNKMRTINMMKVTREIQSYLNQEDHDAKVAQEVSILEQTILMQKRHHEANVDIKKKILGELKHNIKDREVENRVLLAEIEDLNVGVNERQHIHEAGTDKNLETTRERRYQEIVQRRKLVDLAKAQANEVAVLRAEVERLRMRTFPALVQVER